MVFLYALATVMRSLVSGTRALRSTRAVLPSICMSVYLLLRLRLCTGTDADVDADRVGILR